VARETQASDVTEPVFMRRFGMFDVHFLLLFLGAVPAGACRLHEHRMETAKGRRQSQMTDNRTLTLLSIFNLNLASTLNRLFFMSLFSVFVAFTTSFFF
jgi:hypothetical protein